MFIQVIQASEGLREAMRLNPNPLIPGLCGCDRCQSVRMVTAPVLGVCERCGAEMTVTKAASRESVTRPLGLQVPDAA